MVNAKKISVTELRNIVRSFDKPFWVGKNDTNIGDLLSENEQVIDELNAFDFIELYSLENCDYTDTEQHWQDDIRDANVGYFTFGDLTFLCLTGSGDTEYPVCFILYLGVDDKLHGFVPKEGNQYNTFNGKPIGCEIEADDVFLKTKGFNDYIDYDELCNQTGNLYNFFDWAKIREEIINSVKVVH